MEKKGMYLANLNLTFGIKDEPLLEWLDEFVLPALCSGIKREIKNKNRKEPTKILFKDVVVEEIEVGEVVLRGLIIKDTVLDIYNQLENEDLIDDEQHPKSAPYSMFMVFLKNHRMVLVRRQAGSPDLRLFASTFEDILKEYRKKENESRKDKQMELLPTPIVQIKGLKTSTTIDELLDSVDKVKDVTFKLKNRNNEIGGLDGLIDDIETKLLKESNSTQVKITMHSPKSKYGLKKILNEAENMLETELKVQYQDIDEEGNEFKRTATIRDNEIAQKIEIGIEAELKESYREVYYYCKENSSLNIETNNIIDYNKYLKKRKKYGK